MKTLYLVRHGKSEANGKNIYQREDTLLSEEGRRQANILKKRFKNIPVDILYASFLIRAQETAKIINEELNLPIHTLKLVNERVNPSSLLGLSLDGEESMEFRNELVKHIDDSYWKWEDEESFGEVKDRIVQFLNKMREDPNDNILVVMHGLYLKLMLGLVLFGQDTIISNDEDYFNVKNANTGISIFQLKDVQDNWKLVTWNDRAHLGEL